MTTVSGVVWTSMPNVAWRWLPIQFPMADLPRIVSEMCGVPLVETSGGDLTRVWPEYSSVEVERRVASTWSAGSCTVTLRDDFHLVSERGESPVEERIQRARVEIGDVTLVVDGAYYQLEGPPAAVDAIEGQWLAILKRDFFRPTWLDHPLVPDEWRLQARDVSIAPTYNRFLPGSAGGSRYRPAVLLARQGERCVGLLVDQTEALPLGPLPPESGLLLFQCRRPSGQSELDVPDLFMRLLDTPTAVSEMKRSDERLEAPIGFLTLYRTGQLEYVMFRAWRAGPWILRSQYSYPYRSGPTTLSGDFNHEWAIQSEDGGPWAILAQRTQVLFSREEELAVRVVGEADTASAIAGRLLSILAESGWSHEPTWSVEPGWTGPA